MLAMLPTSERCGELLDRPARIGGAPGRYPPSAERTVKQ